MTPPKCRVCDDAGEQFFISELRPCPSCVLGVRRERDALAAELERERQVSRSRGDAIKELTKDLAGACKQRDELFHILKTAYTANLTQISEETRSVCSEPGNAWDVVIKDRDAWKARALKAEKDEARCRKAIEGIKAQHQAEVDDLCDRLIEMESERDLYLENLTAVQERCTELLLENRTLRKGGV